MDFLFALLIAMRGSELPLQLVSGLRAARGDESKHLRHFDAEETNECVRLINYITILLRRDFLCILKPMKIRIPSKLSSVLSELTRKKFIQLNQVKNVFEVNTVTCTTL